MADVGLIGLGAMGRGMAQSLRRAGHRVHVFDVRAEACQAFALVEGRDYVTPGDVKRMAVPVLSHRVLVKSRGADLASASRERERVVHEIVKGVKVPE